MTWDRILVFFAEITLKGKNREFFINILAQKLRAVLGTGFTVKPMWDRLEVSREKDEEFGLAVEKIVKVFGVAHAEPVKELQRDEGLLKAAAVKFYKESGSQGSSFAVRVNRVDKSYPKTSQELEREIGACVLKNTKAETVDLEEPDVKINFRLEKDKAFLFGFKSPGPHGLPVGSSGKVLTLFSGGIDSAVVPWYAMRRGLTTDFLHFHVFRDSKEVEDTKVTRLIEKLVKPQGKTAKLYAAPYHLFQFALMETDIPQKLELILFRRFMVRVAQELAHKHNYQALVTGDNLGQVASQTIENLTALDAVLELPMLRPLLAFNKEETIDRARELGIYEDAAADYKDCCSILARHPAIRPELEEVDEAEDKLPIQELIQDTLEETSTIKI